MANNPPAPQACHNCNAMYAGIACPICKEERPAYAALKRITARENEQRAPYPPCRYQPASLCSCGQRGLCLEPA